MCGAFGVRWNRGPLDTQLQHNHKLYEPAQARRPFIKPQAPTNLSPQPDRTRLMSLELNLKFELTHKVGPMLILRSDKSRSSPEGSENQREGRDLNGQATDKTGVIKQDILVEHQGTVVGKRSKHVCLIFNCHSNKHPVLFCYVSPQTALLRTSSIDD